MKSSSLFLLMIFVPLFIISIVGYFVEESFKNDIAQKCLANFQAGAK